MGSGSASGCGVAATGSGRSMLIAWPALTGWLALAPRPATWTWPSLISRCSCERDRSPSTEARNTSRRTPPPSSGTVMVMLCRLLARRLGCGRCRAREVDEHDDGQRREDDRDELGRREHTDRPALVAPVELDAKPRRGVQQHVQPERAARKRPAFALGGEEQHQNEELGARLVQLRGVQRDAERRPDVGRGEGVRKRDAPRLRRRPPVAAPGEEAAETSNDVA